MFSLKDFQKLIIISIISFCSVFVVHLFLNFYLDLTSLEMGNMLPFIQKYYDAQVSISWLVSTVSGTVLSITSMLLLFFYIRQFIDTHKEQLGILKALGYKEWSIARYFWVFGLSVGLGSFVGYLGSFLMMPHFYQIRNKENLLPEIQIHAHLVLLVYLVMLPTLVFSVIAVVYAKRKLHLPALQLLGKQAIHQKIYKAKIRRRQNSSFLKDLSVTVFLQRKILIFFVTFGSLCFSAMIQLAYSMKDFIDETIQLMMSSIGIILGVSILYLSLNLLISENKETIALLKVFGYTSKETRSCLLTPYRPLAYLGFVLGSIYQYLIFQLILKLIENTLPQPIHVHFNWLVCLVCLFFFSLYYEIQLYFARRKIEHFTIKKIMLSD